MNKKFILDACCGYRMMWFNKQHPNCIYQDIREECNPDIIGNYTELKELKGKKFKLIVFDPHFRLEKHGQPTGFIKSYGKLLGENWKEEFEKAYNNFMELLEDYGILILKWNDSKIKKNEVLNIFPIKPLFGQTTTGTKGKKDKKTYWFCFMKIPKDKNDKR